MDVAKEFKEVNFRIKMDVRRKALEATAKIYGMTAEEYAAKVLAEEHAATLQAAHDGAFQLGLVMGNLARAWNESMEQVAAGIRAAMGK